ncbi:PEBP-like protein [Clavulina sp. PMI_390]|nr:PEBP-like protein [Clavulina sp. PMI_390]
MPLTDYVERTLAWALYNRRGHDDALATRSPAFADVKPTITVKCDAIPDGKLGREYMGNSYGKNGGNLFPPLNWINPPGTAEVLIIVQDPDAPFSVPSVHGLYFGIPPTLTPLSSSFFASHTSMVENSIKLGRNRQGTLYTGAIPLMNHGVHRYFFQVVALRSPLSKMFEEHAWKKETPQTTLAEGTGATVALKDILDVLAERKGEILAWGEWVATCERTSSNPVI